MDRSFYLERAVSGQRMPIGTHLVLHQHKEPLEILRDGRRLGVVVEEAARRFRTPLAFPLMDLTLENAALLTAYGIAETEKDTYHFREPPFEERKIMLTPQMAATCEAISYIARETDLVPQILLTLLTIGYWKKVLSLRSEITFGMRQFPSQTVSVTLSKTSSVCASR